MELPPAERATILHADLDAFYASVEQLLDPSLRNRPIAVGGSVVLAASYEARATASAAACPGGGPASSAVTSSSSAVTSAATNSSATTVVSVFHDFTPRVERVSIDEAFLDVAGAVHLFGAPTEIAAAIRRRVRDEIGLPLSVGVARTKHLAKVASQVAKPDGLVAVDPGDERDFLDPLPVGLIWGVGPTTERRLHEAGIYTIGQLARHGSPILGSLLGQAAGSKLCRSLGQRRRAGGGDTGPVEVHGCPGRPRTARGNSTSSIRETLGYLADRVAGRLRKANLAGRTVTVRVRFAHLRSVTRSVTLPVAISTTLTLTEVAERLAHVSHPRQRTRARDHAPRRVGLQLAPGTFPAARAASRFARSAAAKGEPRPGSVVEACRWGVDRSVDAIREKFGRTAVGYATVALSGAERVPEEFRELAERGPGGSQEWD